MLYLYSVTSIIVQWGFADFNYFNYIKYCAYL